MAGILMGFVYYYDFTKPQRDVLLALADHGKEDGTQVRPSVDTMVWKLDTDRRHIQRTMRELEDMKVLVPVAYANGGRGHATEYEIHLEAAPLKPTPPPGKRMARIWELLKGGLDTALSTNDDTKGGVSTALSPDENTNSGVHSALSPTNSGANTALSSNSAEGRTFEHTKGGLFNTKGGLFNTKGGVHTAPISIEPSYNRQEETARARGATDASLSLSKNENAEAEAEPDTPEADPPLLARRPPYDDRQFRRWALSQTGGWSNLSPKKLDVMMDEYCRVKGIAG